MKRIAAVVTILFCGFLGLMYLLPSDTVTSRYATLTAARSDNLFERGWLPDILPPSAYSIRTSNDLDVNTSEGEFFFAPSDYSLFASRVQPYMNVQAPNADFEASVVRMQSKGLQPSVYVEVGATWVFFCKKEAGYCEYNMWLRRDYPIAPNGHAIAGS